MSKKQNKVDECKPATIQLPVYVYLLVLAILVTCFSSVAMAKVLDLASFGANAHPDLQAATLDGNLGTRWSAGGKKGWVSYRLEGKHVIDSVSIAWFGKGYTRFSIQVSDDGKQWKQTYSGKSNGKTGAFEQYRVNGSGKYIKITAHENSNGSWISISDVVVRGVPVSSPPSEESPLPSAGKTLNLASFGANAHPDLQAATLDGNLGTRWSAGGKKGWVSYRLEGKHVIDSVSIAWFGKGYTRFSIQVSDDGKQWKQIYSGKSNGKTGAFEQYRVNGSGKYIKITAHENSNGSWISISDVVVRGVPVSSPPGREPPPVDDGEEVIDNSPLADIRNPGAYLSFNHRGYNETKYKLKMIEGKQGWVGVKIRYKWSDLNPKEGVYDFSQIESDLSQVKSAGKTLIIAIRHTSWADNHRPLVPGWMLTKRFGGGVFKRTSQGGGWLLLRGHPEVDRAWHNLMRALGGRFNGRIEGINLGETSTGKNPYIEKHNLRRADVFFKYAQAAKKFFPDSIVWQMGNYINPQSDLNYLFDKLRRIGVGSGGPDVHPASGKPGSGHGLEKMYAIHRANSGVVPVSIDIQWDNWNHWALGRKRSYTSEELFDAAIEYVRPNYIVVTGSHKNSRDAVKTFSDKYRIDSNNLIYKYK